MILKTNRDYFHNNNKSGLDRICLDPSSNRKHFQGIDTFLHIKLFSSQLATAGIERAVYKKLIAPFKDDLPATKMDGFRRVCADHNYAFVGPDILNTRFSLSLSCQLVPLPDISYREQWAFIISKNSPYKGLINWR
jgi:hypothetical protein